MEVAGRGQMRNAMGAGLLGLLAVVVPTMQARLTAQATPDLRLAQGRAGQIEVGLPVDEIYRRVGREHTRLIDLHLEGMFEPALEIVLDGASVQPSLIVRVREWPCIAWSVQGIDVRDPRFRTAEGIGVGSTLADVSKAYRVTVGRENGPHAWVDAVKMRFRLDSASLAPTARVTSVWLPGDPVAVRRARCPERGPLGG